MPSPLTLKATRIVEEIKADLLDRAGLQNEWESLDEEIQEEITETWIDIVIENL